MNTRTRLLAQLADGRFHSGTVLGKRLGVSRAAIAKSVQALVRTGLEIDAVRGRGYRLAHAVELLDARRIRRGLGQHDIDLGRRLTVLQDVDSTSQYVAEQLEIKPESGLVCLAEMQSAGRGRRGRSWLTSPCESLLLSVSWQLATGPGLLAGLSLAAGVAIVQALKRYGVADVGLKWPNDVMWNRRKLAGLLLDVRGEATGPCWVVLGVGINGRLHQTASDTIDQPWVDLYTITSGPVRRNDLAIAVIRELYAMFERFARSGFTPFRDAWQQHHLFHNQPVRVIGDRHEVRGVALGVNDTGALRVVDDNGHEHCFYSGDVSLRALS